MEKKKDNRPRKYVKGRKVQSFDEIVDAVDGNKYLWLERPSGGKPIHPCVLVNMQFKVLWQFIRGGWLHRAERNEGRKDGSESD